MGALTIAFDITIVGALALPWVYLVIHLFFSEGENFIEQALEWVNDHGAQVPAGILLFAMTYTLGSAISRIAQDFFNDDDLYVQTDGHKLRWPVTEDRIRAHVYCDDDSNDHDRQNLLPNNPETAYSAMASEIRDLRDPEAVCRFVMKAWITSAPSEGNPDRLVKIMTHIFGIQENTLMDKGDYSARLRQLHDQIMVLRGAAFSGLIAFSLCLFAWGAILTHWLRRLIRPWRRIRLRRLIWLLRRGTFAVTANVFAILLTAVAVIALVHHLGEEQLRFPPDPPYMEFTLLLLAGAGLRLLLPSLLCGSLPRSLNPHSHEEADAGYAGRLCSCPAPPRPALKHWGPLVALSFILTLAAFLGWWSTEVMYRDQVIYSYDSQFSNTQGSAKPKK